MSTGPTISSSWGPTPSSPTAAWPPPRTGPAGWRPSGAGGGRLGVVDPRRSRTAEAADEHVAIRPGTDAHLLIGMVHVLFAHGRADPGGVRDHVAGVEVVE